MVVGSGHSSVPLLPMTPSHASMPTHCLSQVLSLLILASRQRLSPMEAPTVDLLTRSTLRALVVEEAGEQALRAVIHAMQPQEADDALRQALGAECPSFFKASGRGERLCCAGRRAERVAAAAPSPLDEAHGGHFGAERKVSMSMPM